MIPSCEDDTMIPRESEATLYGWLSHLNPNYSLGCYFPPECESQHCGKDAATGLYRPTSWVVTYLNEDAFSMEDAELNFGVCDMWILRVAPLAKTPGCLFIL